MTAQLAVIKNQTPSITEHFTKEEVDIIKQTICKDSTDSVLNLFIMQCKRTGLDPFARQIYSVPRKSKKLNTQTNQWEEETQHTTQVSIDGFRLNAQRTGMYCGQKPVQWCGQDGKWKDIWTGPGFPYAARVGVIRKDFSEPLYAIAKWESYAVEQVYNKDKNARKEFKVKKMWEQMPDHMLAKVAEALALRQAFPQELSGLYTNDEMPSHEEYKGNIEDNKQKEISYEKMSHHMIAKVAEEQLLEKESFNQSIKNQLVIIINDLTHNLKMDDATKKNFKTDMYLIGREQFKNLKLESLIDLDVKKIMNDLIQNKYDFWSDAEKETEVI
jgi:phage recombination protein Bet